MKKSKFWIWFLPAFLILCVGLYISISIVDSMNIKRSNTKDTKVVDEYKEVKEGLDEVNLSDTINYIYVEQDNLSDLINNKDGILFIGNSNDNISRKSLQVLNDSVLSTDIENIYYLNNENINEDTLKLINIAKLSNGMFITFSKGSIVTVIRYEDIESDKLNDTYLNSIKLLIETCDESC